MPTAPRTVSYRRTKRTERRPNAYARGYNDRWRARTAAWIQEQAALGNVRCGICGKPLTGERRDIHVDHKVAPSNLGPVGSDAYEKAFWDEDNWSATHGKCNSRKGNRIA